MASNTKKVKPNEPVEVVMANKFYKPGEKVKVHENIAAKLVSSGKAFKTEAEYNKAAKKDAKAGAASGSLEL